MYEPRPRVLAQHFSGSLGIELDLQRQLGPLQSLALKRLFAAFHSLEVDDARVENPALSILAKQEVDRARDNRFCDRYLKWDLYLAAP